MRIEASIEQWRELYEITIELAAMEPWNYLWDTDLVAVKKSQEEEPVFLSVMGKGGECYGVGAYVGLNGLRDFDMIARSSELGVAPQYAMLEQTSLVCYLGDREEVPPEQKKVIKELGLKFRGKGKWIYFVSYKRRYAPYIPDQEETRILTESFRALKKAAAALKEDKIKVEPEKGLFLWQELQPDTGQWKLDTAPLPDVRKEFSFLEVKDQLLKKRLKNKAKVNAEIILDLVYLNTMIKDKKYDRPANPLVFLAIDAHNGSIISMNLLEPQDKEEEVVLSFVVNFIQEYGRMSVIIARNPVVFGALEDICSYCQIQMAEDELEFMDELLEDMKNHMR